MSGLKACVVHTYSVAHDSAPSYPHSKAWCPGGFDGMPQSQLWVNSHLSSGRCRVTENLASKDLNVKAFDHT